MHVFRQTGVAAVLLNHLWLGKNVKESIDAPRLHHQLVPMKVTHETLVDPVRTNVPFFSATFTVISFRLFWTTSAGLGTSCTSSRPAGACP